MHFGEVVKFLIGQNPLKYFFFIIILGQYYEDAISRGNSLAIFNAAATSSEQKNVVSFSLSRTSAFIMDFFFINFERLMEYFFPTDSLTKA